MQSVVLVGTAVDAKVTPAAGQRDQVFGTDQKREAFSDWLMRPESLVTPEAANLAAQACMRATQESLDVFAYREAQAIVDSMENFFRSARVGNDPYLRGLQAVSGFLGQLRDLETTASDGGRAQYQSDCERVAGDFLKANPDAFEVLYYGRIHPKSTPAMVERGIRLAGIDVGALKEQICKMEGYYSVSNKPELWKLFSITRTLSNMLPKEDESDQFVEALEVNADLLPHIRKLDEYSSVAGKINGPTFSQTPEEREKMGPRTTGVGFGNGATSAMAFFTTGWRETLQDLILTRPYSPKVPFQLLRGDEIFKATEKTAKEIAGKSASQTEVGIGLVHASLNDKSPSYGANTEKYRRTAGMAWLALNAETNVRQNEKLGGVGAGIEPEPPGQVFGNPTQYQQVAKSIAAAKTAYLSLVPATEFGRWSCLTNVTDFATAAAKVPAGQVGKVDPKLIRGIKNIRFPSILVDLGTEVSDQEDGVFKLHLGTSPGRVFPAKVAGSNASYTVWTPAAFSLHLSKTTSTGDWMSMVQNYDKLPPTP